MNRRMCEMPPRFQEEVIKAWAQRLEGETGGVEVLTEIRFKRTA